MKPVLVALGIVAAACAGYFALWYGTLLTVALVGKYRDWRRRRGEP